jgi:hypothetical protein
MMGVAFFYQITANNTPGSFGASGLPLGLTIKAVSGLIYGTPTESAPFNVTLSATNNGGTGSAPPMVAPPAVNSSGNLVVPPISKNAMTDDPAILA